MKRRKFDPTQQRQRAITFEIRAADEGADSFTAALSSDAPIRVWRDLEEVLTHTAEAIDLGRAAGGLPLLWQHDAHTPIGRVDDLVIDGGKLRGRFTFAPNAKAQEVRADVAGGFLRNVSIGYVVHDWIEKDQGRVIEATRWELMEASIVSVPADPGVGINRAASAKATGGRMKRKGPNGGADNGGADDGDDGDNVIEFTEAQRMARDQGMAEGRRAEAERRSAIDLAFAGERFSAPEFQQIRTAALAECWSVQRAKDELLRALGSQAAPTAPGSAFTQGERPAARAGEYGRVSVGADAMDRFMRGAELQMCVRAGLESDRTKIRESRESELGGLTMYELAREYCHLAGINIAGKRRDQVCGLALSRRAAGVVSGVAADFPSLLENIAGKALLVGYEEAEETWRMIARPGVLTDFRPSSRTGLSEFDDLDLLRDGGEYKVGKFLDRGEPIRLASFGKLLRLSRAAIVNDDLNAFSQAPRKLGRAASRTVGDVVYNAFLTNPTLNQDGLALFVAGHNNLVSAGNGPPGVAQLSTMKALMGKQKDNALQANGLNIRPARVIVPLALEDAARTLQTAEFNPLITATNSASPNIHRGTFETVADARLDTVSAVQWYAFADPLVNDVIEVGFLDGIQEPYLEAQDGWTIDGVEWKVRIDVAAAALDFRTMVRNNG